MSQGIDEGTKSHKPRAQRVKFSQSEDELLKSLVQQSENPDWKMIATFFKNRNGRQCRERWKHYLSISPVDKKWTFEEDQQLFLEVQQFGTKWTQLVKYHPGRSDLQLRAQYHKILEQSPDGHMFQKPLLQTQMTPVDMNSSINPALTISYNYFSTTHCSKFDISEWPYFTTCSSLFSIFTISCIYPSFSIYST